MEEPAASPAQQQASPVLNGCNPAVGFVGTPEIAESIAAYLRKHA